LVETIVVKKISNAKTIRIQRLSERLSRQLVCGIRAIHSGIDQGSDAPERLSGRETGVAADSGDVLGKGVEVLLSGHELRCTSDDLRVVAKRGDDFVGQGKLLKPSVNWVLEGERPNRDE